MRLVLHAPSGDIHEVFAPRDLTPANLLLQLNAQFAGTGASLRNVDWKLLRRDTGEPLASHDALAKLKLTPGEHLLLVCESRAAAYRNPREDRLRWERLDLEELNRESETVHAQAINVLPGTEPEEYRITLRCKGILKIDSAQQPIFGYTHRMLLHCGEGFPTASPVLYCETDIWHPNIDHQSKGVCINAKEWVGGRSLRDVCRQVFEMVQYKSYHAILEDPFPLDLEVARWVREFAEPQGILDKRRGIFVDNRPFTKLTFVRSLKEHKTPVTKPSTPRLRVLDQQTETPSASLPSKKPRLKLAGQ